MSSISCRRVLQAPLLAVWVGATGCGTSSRAAADAAVSGAPSSADSEAGATPDGQRFLCCDVPFVRSADCNCVCPDGGDGTLSGTVYDPARKNPVYGASVYLQSIPLLVLPDGSSCAACKDLYSGAPIASAVTDAAGHFIMHDVPGAQNVPLETTGLPRYD
ncbi:MAG TPA: hypothetical protein VKU41_11705 [Polyangiaceae bacterium]|nr:hypothetical protein [Polyangiaceae bacterium]